MNFLDDAAIRALPALTFTPDELDEIPRRELPEKEARAMSKELYDALLDRHGRLERNCKRCPVRPRKCPWGDGLLHEQQVGVDPTTKDRFFVARCDNPGCPTRRTEPLKTRAEKEAEEKRS